MLTVLKRIAVFLAIGGVVGDVLTMLIAPGFVTWFHTPVGSAAMCNCAENSRQTASALINAQLIGTALGAVAVAVIGELGWRLLDARRKQRSSGGSGGGQLPSEAALAAPSSTTSAEPVPVPPPPT